VDLKKDRLALAELSSKLHGRPTPTIRLDDDEGVVVSQPAHPDMNNSLGSIHSTAGLKMTVGEDLSRSSSQRQSQGIIKRNSSKSANVGVGQANARAPPSMVNSIVSPEEHASLPDSTLAQRKKNKATADEMPTDPYVITPTAGHDPTAPQIRKFKKRFNSEVLCGSFWGSNIMVGTKQDLSLLDRTGDGKVRVVGRNRWERRGRGVGLWTSQGACRKG
jgi:hypothetical protein